MEHLPPVGKAARTAVAGATAAKVGAKHLSLLVKRPFLSADRFREQRDKSDHEAAEMIFGGLSTLRGGALKLAQMLSFEVDALPDAYRRELDKSHYRVPSLNRAVVRQIITRELGAPPEKVFDAFDTTAFAAASLGQVHRARSHGGEPLAVKIQYPGIGTALKNDLRLLQQFLLPFARSEYLRDAVRELEVRLSEEVDYALERRATQWFCEHGQTPGVVVPKAFDEYSSACVLTTEFINGLHLDRWLQADPSRAQRDHAAQAIYDFFVRSFAERHRIHSDPNPGNYLFRRDGSVAVVDFGSVKTFGPELCERILRSWRAIIQGDAEQVITHYCSLGIGRGDRRLVKRLYRSHLAPLDEWMRLPYQEDVFDFGEHADYCAQGARLYRDTVRREVMNGFTPETLLFDRNIYGLYRLFTELKARVRLKNRWIF